MAPADETRLSAEQQIERMRAEYPGFAVHYATPWLILWRGELQPLARPYEVQVLYCAISMPLAAIERFEPHVEIVQPLLARRPAAPEIPIPHIFPNRVFPDRPRLCLYRGAEWTPALYIADTILLWTIEWLAAYECWRATGVWLAGGHGTERDETPHRGHRREASRMKRRPRS